MFIIANPSQFCWAGDMAISANLGYHNAVIHSDGTVYTWGNNTTGQLGDNSETQRTTPVTVYTSGALASKNVTAVSAGWYHSLALDSDGKVYAWGDNTNGQLGDNSTTSSSVPVSVYTAGALNGKSITAIAAGLDHTLALDSDGIVYAWGDNTSGQLGDGSNSDSKIPVAVSTAGILSGKTISAIAVGFYFSVAMDSDGKVYTWGSNSSGQLGNNSTTASNIPVAVSTSGLLSSKTIVDIEAGNSHCLVLDNAGDLFSWGANNDGQLGNESYDASLVPVAVDMTDVLSGKTINAIASGRYHSLALDSDGKVYTWGLNGSGNLGDASYTKRNTPVAVDVSGVLSGKVLTAIAGGSSHCLALGSDGAVYSWGLGTSGQLGVGSTSSSNIPVRVQSSGTDFSLPVSLSTFTIKSKIDHIALSWTTESEIENIGFIVERRDNSIGSMSGWRELASYVTDNSLNGHGSTSASNEYSYIDRAVQPGLTYEYRLSDVDYKGIVNIHFPVSILCLTDENNLNPSTLKLSSIYPNPFNPSTTISFELLKRTNLTLSVYDLMGHEIWHEAKGEIAVGPHEIVWRGVNQLGEEVSAGAYIVSLKTPQYQLFQKVILIK